MVQTVKISLAFNPKKFSDAAVNYLNGCVTNYYRAVNNISIQKYTSTPKKLYFNGNTIKNLNNLDTDSFINTYGFVIGETIIIPASASNNGNLVITGLTDKTITVSTTLTTETLPVGYIYMNTKVTALDYYYNLINNQEAISFLSKTDINTLQKYTVTGIDPTVGAPVNLQVGTKSFAWVTDGVTAPSQTTSTIVGTGWTGNLGQDTPAHIAGSYIQSFTIYHNFYLAPYFLAPLLSYFQTDSPPPDFQDGQINGSPLNNGWQYICQVNAKYAAGIAYQNTGQNIPAPGNVAWFDQNDSRTVPEFSTASVSYVDAVTGNPLTALDIGKSVNVTIKIKSASGLFVNVAGDVPGTTLTVSHIYCPLDASSYENTATTLGQNFMGDTQVTTVGAAAVNGITFGTPYQLLSNILATFVDAYNVTVTFNVKYAALLLSILQGKSVNDRNYLLTICTETITD